MREWSVPAAIGSALADWVSSRDTIGAMVYVHIRTCLVLSAAAVLPTSRWTHVVPIERDAVSLAARTSELSTTHGR